MPLPDEVPLGLTEEFAMDASRRSLWDAFLKKNGLTTEPLLEVVRRLRDKLWPAIFRARALTEDTEGE